MQPLNQQQRLQSLQPQSLEQLFLSHFKSNQFDACLPIITQIQSRGHPISQQLVSLMSHAKFIVCKIAQAEQHFSDDISSYRVDQMKSDNASVKISSKLANNEMHIAAEGEAELNILPVASIIVETSLYPQWMPLCKLAEDALRLGPAEKVAYTEYSLPLLPRKGTFIYGCLIDRLKYNNTLVVYFAGVTNRKQYQELFKREFKLKISPSLFQLKFGILEATLIGENRFKFRVCSVTEIKFTVLYVPGGILGFFIKKVVGHLFKVVMEKVKGMKGTEWEKKVENDQTGVYRFVMEKYEEMKGGLQKQEEEKKQQEKKSNQ